MIRSWRGFVLRAWILALMAGCSSSGDPPEAGAAGRLRSRLTGADFEYPLFGDLPVRAEPGPGRLRRRQAVAADRGEASESFAPYVISASLQALLLCQNDAPRHRDRIEECARQLVRSQARDGGWAYYVVDERPEPLAFNSRNCVAHLAALGLEACQRAGVEVPRETLEWVRATGYGNKTRREDGGAAAPSSAQAA